MKWWKRIPWINRTNIPDGWAIQLIKRRARILKWGRYGDLPVKPVRHGP